MVTSYPSHGSRPPSQSPDSFSGRAFRGQHIHRQGFICQMVQPELERVFARWQGYRPSENPRMSPLPLPRSPRSPATPSPPPGNSIDVVLDSMAKIEAVWLTLVGGKIGDAQETEKYLSSTSRDVDRQVISLERQLKALHREHVYGRAEMLRSLLPGRRSVVAAVISAAAAAADTEFAQRLDKVGGV
ncbi:unnamed protein product [Polarella glacialis]|uniref:Uncharacterized protein n=1 Tax=Polarella glacialis TaxID=89957 RepID=A0A813DM64_POLGL|nr:unnamed protein product [Polarella glacialis]